MHDFLDFLKLTCQVHQSITTKDESPHTKIVLDYNNLAQNELVNSLLSAKANASHSPKAADGESSASANGATGVFSNNSFDRKGMRRGDKYC